MYILLLVANFPAIPLQKYEIHMTIVSQLSNLFYFSKFAIVALDYLEFPASERLFLQVAARHAFTTVGGSQKQKELAE